MSLYLFIFRLVWIAVAVAVVAACFDFRSLLSRNFLSFHHHRHRHRPFCFGFSLAAAAFAHSFRCHLCLCLFLCVISLVLLFSCVYILILPPHISIYKHRNEDHEEWQSDTNDNVWRFFFAFTFPILHLLIAYHLGCMLFFPFCSDCELVLFFLSVLML